MNPEAGIDGGELLRNIRMWALEAGGMLLAGMEDVHEIDAKAGTEFVTEMDRQVEDYLLERIGTAYPEDRIAAEESGWSGKAGKRTWYVDPLDGTTNYAHGYPIFGVSIACAEADAVLAGGVFAPYLDELYLAERGAGARVQRPSHGTSRRLSRPETRTLTESLVATGFPYERDQLVDKNTELAGAFLKQCCHGLRRGGSAAVDLCHVAAGKLDGFWEFKLRPWDTAAGTLIAREAGIRVTDFAGQESPIHTATILAAVHGLHGEMLSILAEHDARGCAPSAASYPGGMP